MKIALASPVDLRALETWIDPAPGSGQIPRGMGSTAVTPLVAALLARGHQVTLFTLSWETSREVVLRGGQLTVFVGPSRAARRARDLWRAEVEYLRGAIRREQPGFLHAHWSYEFALGALKSGVPTLVTLHDLPWNVLRYFRDPYRAARLLLAYQVAARGQRFTAVSEDAARHFRRYFSPRARVEVIPNFLDDAVFAMGERVPPPHPFTFATALQGWTTRKNPAAALRAFARVRAHLPQARLLMLGQDFEPDGPADRWAQSQGMAPGVEFRGSLPYAEMLRTLHAEADILVHPSRDESFSMAALEAMALGKPVIAGRATPGVREVLEFGRCGVLVEVTDAAAIAGAMLALAQDRAERDALSARAWDSAWRRFRTGPVVAAYERLYAELDQARSAAASFTDLRADAKPAPGAASELHP